MIAVPFITVRHTQARLRERIACLDGPERLLAALWYSPDEASVMRAISDWLTGVWLEYQAPWLRTCHQVPHATEFMSTPRYIMDIDEMRLVSGVTRWKDAMISALTELRQRLFHWRAQQRSGANVDCETPVIYIEHRAYQIEWFIQTRMALRP